jgi:hypothetical protein
LVGLQENFSRQMVAALDAWRDASETVAERTFLTVYGSPTLQAAAGIDPDSTRPLRRAGKNPLHSELLQKRIAELKSRIPAGGLREAFIRGLLYAGMGRGGVDERGFEAVRRLRQAHPDISLSEFKGLVREQFYMLLIDTEAALAVIPSMLPADAKTRRKGFELIKEVMSARGELSAEDKERLLRVARLFELPEESSTVRSLAVVPAQAKAS